jgi:hypothetical protein
LVSTSYISFYASSHYVDTITYLVYNTSLLLLASGEKSQTDA